ncbi:SIR2 family protein [candidate division KSB1 bacterium]|nr:SIR2 family protein [candidate division KSB1 bacterium]
MEIEEAIKLALGGDSILFVGAGYSSEALNIKKNNLKNSLQLSEHFAKLAGISESLTLEDAAEIYLEKYGIDELIREIKNEFTIFNVQQYHNDIACIPWKRIYTTNYDNVMEKSYNNVGKKITPITIKNDISKEPKNFPMCIHLNGYVESLNRDSLFSELKLTESSYITASLINSPWATLFRQDIRLARSIFFIGYSGYDLDIKRILAQSEMIKRKTFFFVGLDSSPTITRRCKLFGDVFKETASQFTKKVNSIKKEYKPPVDSEFSPLSLKEYKPIQLMKKITDRDFIDLLMFGKRKEDLIYESLSTEKKYYLERTKINDVFQYIEKDFKIIVICSDLGNGKSLFLDGMRLRALEKGFRVFEPLEQNDLVYSEIEKITSMDMPIFLTIENYQNWFDEILLYLNNCNSESVLILTARNAINDVFIDELTNKANIDFIPEIQIDTLDEKEINWFLATLDEYGLWGEDAGKSMSQKQNLLVDKYKGQIHAILLSLLDSPDISSRLKTLTDNLKDDGDLFKVTISLFILTILNFRTTLDDLADLWDSEIINNGHFRRNQTINELIEFSTSNLSIRSPILAEYFLRHLTDSGYIINTLITMAERVDRAAKYSKKYRSLFPDLIRFHSLQLILPIEGKKAAVIKYYESIKNLYGCKDHPLFWLQYAIASLVIDDLFRAKKYFDTAYSLAEKKDWDTYQIDNHFARFLLVESIKLPPEKCMDNFRSARRIINRQIRKERRHYPYRIAIGYQDFIDKFGISLKTDELKEVKFAARDVLQRIQELPDNRRTHRYVKKCFEIMTYVIEKTDAIIAKNDE